MVSLVGRVVQRRKDVFALEIRVIRQDLLERSSRPEQFEHIRNTDAQSTNAGPAPTLAGFHRDSIEAIQIHRISCNFDDTHSPVQRQERAASSSVNFQMTRIFPPARCLTRRPCVPATGRRRTLRFSGCPP